ncbi:TPA: hypothetical protein HA251_07020 [Candidatus Woesearchaeota archaeon]|nr:hypothetical protein [Candidatus Woesearchaeota archaeon]
MNNLYNTTEELYRATRGSLREYESKLNAASDNCREIGAHFENFKWHFGALLLCGAVAFGAGKYERNGKIDEDLAGNLKAGATVVAIATGAALVQKMRDSGKHGDFRSATEDYHRLSDARNELAREERALEKELPRLKNER